MRAVVVCSSALLGWHSFSRARDRSQIQYLVNLDSKVDVRVAAHARADARLCVSAVTHPTALRWCCLFNCASVGVSQGYTIALIFGVLLVSLLLAALFCVDATQRASLRRPTTLRRVVFSTLVQQRARSNQVTSIEPHPNKLFACARLRCSHSPFWSSLAFGAR